jgi:hypothetical protein
MDKEHLYQLLADGVLALHVLLVAFVVVALLLTVCGGILHWGWVRNWWFRVVHLACISVVVAQSWLGLICPLTILENWLRRQSGSGQYDGSFIQYWLERLLYYEAPGWVFMVVYTMFGLLVVITWWRFPPQKNIS